MSQRQPPNNDELNKVMARLEQEFQQRHQTSGGLPPDEQPVEQVGQGSRQVLVQIPVARVWLAYLLLAVNVLMFGLTLFVSNTIQLPYQDAVGNVYIDAYTAALGLLGAKENTLINAGQWWRLLTPVVLHGDLMHLLFNSWALFVFGPLVERIYGTLRFAVVYVLSGLGSSIASYVFNPEALSIGASGAIFGLIGTITAYTYVSRHWAGPDATKMQLGQMAVLAIINLAIGFAPGSNIDNAGHIGGLITGAIVGYGFAPRYDLVKHAGQPILERRDSPLVGWAVAVATLLALVAFFVWV